MKLRQPLLLLLALAALAASGPALADSAETVRTLSLDLSAADAEALELEVPVGDVEVEGTDGSRVALAVEVRCERPVRNRCEEAARRLELAYQTRGGRLQVELDQWPDGRGNDGLSVRVDVEMPRAMKLDADLGVGEFDTVGLVGDLALELGVGEAKIRGREDSVRRVNLEVGVGEAILRLTDREIEGEGFIGKELDWRHGRGRAAVEVECGVGEVDVRLED